MDLYSGGNRIAYFVFPPLPGSHANLLEGVVVSIIGDGLGVLLPVSRSTYTYLVLHYTGPCPHTPTIQLQLAAARMGTAMGMYGTPPFRVHIRDPVLVYPRDDDKTALHRCVEKHDMKFVDGSDLAAVLRRRQPAVATLRTTLVFHNGLVYREEFN
jgi:hypothetical protein